MAIFVRAENTRPFRSGIMDNDKKWESLLKISEEAHTASSVEEFVSTIHEILKELVIAKNFFVCLFDDSTGKYFFPFFVDEKDRIETAALRYAYDESLEVTLYDLSGTLTDYVRRTGKPKRFPNPNIDKLYRSGDITLYGSQSTSWLGVPLKLSGQTKGVMAVQCYDLNDAYSSKDEELMVFISNHIARAIESVRTEEKIRKQNQLLLQQKQAITDSFSYARRIQKAVLPTATYIDLSLPDHFTIFRPKDIIGGDFYWVREIGGKKVIIVADCTGHGVPGALMSMLGVTLLNEHFRNYGIRPPDLILGHLRNKVKEILYQEGSDQDQRDGMDMAIAIIDPEKMELQYAGANIPLLMVRDKKHATAPDDDLQISLENNESQLYRIRADLQPVGVHWEEKDYISHTIPLYEQDSLYMFTDGFADQFGGKSRSKYKSSRLKQLLLSVQGGSMAMQKKAIEYAYEGWKGSNEQIDDVCAVGVRISFQNH